MSRLAQLLQLDLFQSNRRSDARPDRRFTLPASYSHNGKIIDFKLLRQRRRKKMAIYVLTGGRVEIRVPVNCPNIEIDRFVKEKLEWILDKRSEVPAAKVRHYLPGEAHPFLGKNYPLDIVVGTQSGIELTPDNIQIRVRGPLDASGIKKRLHGWYRKEALKRLPGYLDECLRRAGEEFSVSELVIRKMRSRWGSCSRDGVICLNSLLIREPPHVIRYVITHELCHLKHFHHRPAFYSLLGRLMPEWKDIETQLNGIEGID